MGPDWRGGELWGFVSMGGSVILSTFQDEKCSKGSRRGPSAGIGSLLGPINGGRFQLTSGHIRVGKQSTGRDIRIVNIGAVIGQGHVIPRGERQWIVNHRIDLRTFNDIY